MRCRSYLNVWYPKYPWSNYSIRRDNVECRLRSAHVMFLEIVQAVDLTDCDNRDDLNEHVDAW